MPLVYHALLLRVDLADSHVLLCRALTVQWMAHLRCRLLEAGRKYSRRLSIPPVDDALLPGAQLCLCNSSMDWQPDICLLHHGRPCTGKVEDKQIEDIVKLCCVTPQPRKVSSLQGASPGAQLRVSCTASIAWWLDLQTLHCDQPCKGSTGTWQLKRSVLLRSPFVFQASHHAATMISRKLLPDSSRQYEQDGVKHLRC